MTLADVTVKGNEYSVYQLAGTSKVRRSHFTGYSSIGFYFAKGDLDLGTAKEVATALKEGNVRVHVGGPQLLRACTHLDVSAAQAERAAETIRQAVPRLTPANG